MNFGKKTAFDDSSLHVQYLFGGTEGAAGGFADGGFGSGLMS